MLKKSLEEMLITNSVSAPNVNWINLKESERAGITPKFFDKIHSLITLEQKLSILNVMSIGLEWCEEVWNTK